MSMRKLEIKLKSFLNYVLLVPLLLAFAACGDDGQLPTSSSFGSLLIQAQDAPVDNLLKFEITVDSIELNPGSVPALNTPVEIELTSLQLTTDTIRLATNIPAGTYTSAIFTFSNAEVKFCPEPPAVCDETTLIEIDPLPLQNTSATVNVNLTITANATAALLVDFDLAASLLSNATTITGVDPMLTATLRDVEMEDDELEEEGRVVSINSTSPNSGTFVLEPFSSCQNVTITVDANTEFEDFDEAETPLPNSFDSLAVNQFVDVDADLQMNGDLLATEVELEDEDEEEEAEGVVLSVDAGAGEFTLLAKEVVPCSAAALPGDIITVTVDQLALPDFRIDEDDLTVDATLFDQLSDLTPGQQVDVDPVGALGASVTAEKIKLDDQTIRGTVVAGSQMAPNFELDPGSDLFVDQTITVRTSTVTEFDDVTGVGSLTDGQAVRVKGLLFLQAGQLIFEAEKVDGTP